MFEITFKKTAYYTCCKTTVAKPFSRARDGNIIISYRPLCPNVFFCAVFRVPFPFQCLVQENEWIRRKTCSCAELDPSQDTVSVTCALQSGTRLMSPRSRLVLQWETQFRSSRHRSLLPLLSRCCSSQTGCYVASSCHVTNVYACCPKLLASQGVTMPPI